MGAATAILSLWIVFAVTHMTFSSVRWRPRLVSALGGRAFLGLYSLIALVLFVPMVAVYFGNKHAGPLLWFLGGSTAVRWLGYVGMGISLALLVGGLLRPSPAAVTPGKAEVAGVFRIKRHPVFMAFGLFGLVQLVMAPVYAADLAFFAGFPVFAVLGSRHQDQRKLMTAGEAFRHFEAATPFLPFSGADRLRGMGEMRWAIAIGIGLGVLLRSFHSSLFN